MPSEGAKSGDGIDRHCVEVNPHRTVRIADDPTPWLVVGFLALVVLAAVALKKDVT
jgi:hypothetical protein